MPQVSSILKILMQYNEVRKDYLLDRWVVIAKDRSRRPTDLSKPRPQIAKAANCPMCVGNESMTPPAVMLFQNLNGIIKKVQDPLTGKRSKDWLVRVIPNLYPAFAPPKYPKVTEQIFKGSNFGYAIGDHEVVVESPEHNEEPAEAELSQIELIIKAYIERFKELSNKPYVKYVSVFRNFGLEAGASLSHAHSQIIATPMIPPIVQQEQQAAEAYIEKQGRCVFCDIIEQERRGERLILENDAFVVFAPYASINPMEFWIVPKAHAANIANITAEEVKSFAQTLRTSLKALKTLVNNPPYNYGIHQTINTKGYHWHLEVYPKLAIWAGFEKSTGIYINTIPPEVAAKELKKVIKS